MAFGSVAAPRTKSPGLASSTCLITSSTLGVPGMNSRKMIACLAAWMAWKAWNMSPGQSGGPFAPASRLEGTTLFGDFVLLFVFGENQTVVLAEGLGLLFAVRKPAAWSALGSSLALAVSSLS